MTDQLPLPMPENRVALAIEVGHLRRRVHDLEVLCASLLDVLGVDVRRAVEEMVAEDDDGPG